MTENRKAKIEERGNGFAGVGEYVTEAGEIYRIVSVESTIHTGAPGIANYIHGVVEPADWADVDDDTEPYCTAVVDEA